MPVLGFMLVRQHHCVFFSLFAIRISAVSCFSNVCYFNCYLKNLLPFLGPLLRKSSEAYRNLSVIKSLRQSENLQVWFIVCGTF